jgi:mRNA interferase RelE/StbE
MQVISRKITGVIVKITRTARFKKAWKELSREEKSLARKAPGNLIEDLRYPALRVKKIQGVGNIWEARASRSLRITFEIKKDTVILRNTGRHDDTLE